MRIETNLDGHLSEDLPGQNAKNPFKYFLPPPPPVYIWEGEEQNSNNIVTI
jgi:hypothetical protein